MSQCSLSGLCLVITLADLILSACFGGKLVSQNSQNINVLLPFHPRLHWLTIRVQTGDRWVRGTLFRISSCKAMPCIFNPNDRVF